MRLWPFGKAEHRNVTFTDATTGAQLEFASGGGLPAVAEQLAAVETAAGLWQRAFASATVTPDIPALTPTVLGSIGRQLAVQGEGQSTCPGHWASMGRSCCARVRLVGDSRRP